MKIVYLSDHKEDIKNMIDSTQYQFIEDAIALLSHYNLRYNLNTGKVLDSNGVKCEYSYKKDIPVNPSIEDVIKFELLPFVKNECKRMQYFKEQNKTYYY